MTHETFQTDSRAVTPVVGAILLVGMVLIVSSTIAVVALGQFGGTEPNPAPAVVIDSESQRIDNGIPKDDAVVLTHRGGETLLRGNIIVKIGSDTVFNRSVNGDVDGTGSVSVRTKGLIVEVDSGPFNDLNKPGSGPSGDGDGDSSNVVNQWGDGIRSGDRLVIQERNNAQSYDVIDAGDRIVVIFVDTEDRRFVIMSDTV
jgi:FlaG/FlaF family flagellin (archaellin)